MANMSVPWDGSPDIQLELRTPNKEQPAPQPAPVLSERANEGEEAV